MKQFQKLYAVEEKIRNRKQEALIIVLYRKIVAVSVLNELEQLVKRHIYEVLSKSAIEKNIAHTLNIWSEL